MLVEKARMAATISAFDGILMMTGVGDNLGKSLFNADTDLVADIVTRKEQ